MLHSLKRTLKSRQIGQVVTSHLISGTAGTPADSGRDQMYVSSVTDLGVGSYKINFKDAGRLDVAVLGLVSATSGKVAYVAAVDESSVTIGVKTDAGVAADGDFYLTCMHATQLDTLF